MDSLDEREQVLERCIALLRQTPTDVLIAYEEVLFESAEVDEPPLFDVALN